MILNSVLHYMFAILYESQSTSQTNNCKFSTMQSSVYMASMSLVTAKRKCKNWLSMIKKHFVLISRSLYMENITSLTKPRSMSLSACKLVSSFHFFSFPPYLSILFFCIQNQAWKFVKNNFHYWSFPTITEHGTEKVLPMKFETLGLLRPYADHDTNSNKSVEQNN